MMMTLFNSLSELNEFMDEATYRLSGNVDLDGGPNLSLSTMQASGEMPMPAPMVLAGWWGDKFNRLFLNAVKTPSSSASASPSTCCRSAASPASKMPGWPIPEVRAGDEVPVKVFLRPYRGERIERDFTVKIPAGLAKGEHRILLSDADTVNRMQSLAGIDEPLHRPAADGFADQPGAQQQQAVRLAAGSQPHRLLRRQDAAQPARVGAECDAGGTRLQPPAGDFAGERLRTDVAAVRLCDQRQLLAEDHREVREHDITNNATSTARAGWLAAMSAWPAHPCASGAFGRPDAHLDAERIRRFRKGQSSRCSRCAATAC